MPAFHRIANLFRRDKLQREIEAELAAHIAMRTEDNIAAGMSVKEARRDARLRFGNRSATHERTVHADAALWLESFGFDLRYALRQLGKNPGFTTTAILMMALGLAASVAIFAFVDAALIQPLPYHDPSRLVAVYEVYPGCPLCNVSRQNWQDWRRTDTVFSSFQTWGWASYLLPSSEGTTTARGARVSDGFFHVLGVTPMLGRDFYSGEEKPGAPRTVLLSYAAWQKRFGSNPGVVGQSVRLSDNDYTIIGVLPREFHFAPLGEADFWTALNEMDSCEQRRGCHNLFGVARLKDGVTVRAADSEMRTLAAQLGRQYPDSNQGYSALAMPLGQSIVGEIRPVLLTLLGGAVLLWLIACVNVVSLLLVRSESRRHEIAVRGALGASRSRLARQFLTEGLVLVGFGTGLGLALAYLAMKLLLKLIPAGRMEAMPFLLGLGLHSHVLIFAAGLALMAALLFCLAPSLRMAFASQSSSLRAGLASGGRSGASDAWRRLGSRLIVVELATAVVLLVGAGLLGKSLYLLLRVNLGMQPDHLATLVVSVPTVDRTDGQVVQLERQIQDRITSLPGVKSASISSHLPAHSWDGGVELVVPGQPVDRNRPATPERDVSASYLPSIGARLLAGRYFTQQEDDPARPRLVVVNESLARQFFPGQNAVGKRLAYNHSKDSMEIVGVIDDIK
jgi:predicted permease